MTSHFRTLYNSTFVVDFPSAYFRLQLLAYINTFRRLHGTGPVILSEQITTQAQLWAKKISSEGVSKLDPNTKFGVNLYTGSGSREELAHSCVVTWYESVRNYDWASPKVSVNSMHFTQLVWQTSFNVGVGVARGLRGRFYVVAYFDPPGNKGRKLKENILPYTGTLRATSKIDFARKS